jgi:hypothetical protein
MMNTQEEIPGYTPAAQTTRWFQNEWFSRGFLIVAALFFFLPFIDIKCSGTKLASVKGSDMIFGTELKLNKEAEGEETADSTSAGEDENVTGWNFPTGPAEQGDNKQIAPNALAIGAFASVIVALILSFFRKRILAIIAGGLALLAALGLFFIQFQVHNEVETKLGPMLAFTPMTFEFTPFYWCCLLFLTLAAVFAFVRSASLTSRSI